MVTLLSKKCRLIELISTYVASLNLVVYSASTIMVSTGHRSGTTLNCILSTSRSGRQISYLPMVFCHQLIAFSGGASRHISHLVIVGPSKLLLICLNTVRYYCTRFAGSRGWWLNHGHNIAIRMHTSGSVFRLRLGFRPDTNSCWQPCDITSGSPEMHGNLRVFVRILRPWSRISKQHSDLSQESNSVPLSPRFTGTSGLLEECWYLC